MAEGWNGALNCCRQNKGPRDSNESDRMNSISNTSTVTCRFYVQGRCSFGSNCRFSHQQPLNSNQQTTDSRHISTSEQTPSNSLSPKSPKTYFSLKGKSANVKKEASIDNTKSKLADFVNAPEFVPKSNQQKSYASTVVPADPNENGSDILCPFAIIGECRYGDQCNYVHGELCDLCEKLCLHPTDDEQRKKHLDECLREHERDMEISFAVQRSQDKCCGICMDTVLEKENTVERRFGILENCNHVFCLTCIRKWRSAKQFDNKIVRACPECRVCSDFVTPSAYWVEDEGDKTKLIEDYKKALSKKPCKYFMQGRGECPFAGNCFYLHQYPDGTKAELPPPQQRRRRTNFNGDFDSISTDFLWNFIEQRDSSYLFFDLETLDYVIESDDDSDYSDLELFFH